jgi:hypothetical protein
MAKPNVEEPRIRFKIAGIIALCVSENKRRFDVGVVRAIGSNGVPGHDFSMVIKKHGDPTPIVSYDSATIPKQLFLQMNVSGQPSSVGIELYAPEIFNRKRPRENNHFRWALDIGNGELHSGPVNIFSAAIRSVLHVTGIESAMFYTDNLSKRELEIKDKHGPRKLGSIAGTIEALIPLPPGGAKFFDGNGGAPHLLNPEEDVTYDITIQQVCSSIETCSEADAEEVYRGLFRTGISGQEIDIIGMAGKDVTPEIGCVGLNFSANTGIPPAS